MLLQSIAGMTASSRTLHWSAILRLASAGIGRCMIQGTSPAFGSLMPMASTANCFGSGKRKLSPA